MKAKKTKQNTAAVVGATPSVLGATPLSDIPFHGGTRQQKRAAAEDDLRSGDTGVKQPATVKIVKFHKVPPRTEIVEKENAQHGSDSVEITFKERSKAEGAPAGLGEISASIWAKTSMSKGGAKDHAAGPIAKAASIMAERMELKGDERAALLSSEGFKAYADEMIWGVRAPGEADDSPLDADDPLQVRGRLREVWRSWRKLPVAQQREWGDKQLTQEMAAALKRATTAGKPHAKGRRAAASVSTAEPSSRSSKGKSKKLDGWRYVAAPKHTSKGARPSEEAEQDEQQRQRPASGKGNRDQQGKRTKNPSAADINGQQVQEEENVDRQYDAVMVNEAKLDEQYRRAEALRFSKAALLAEMRSWEEEDEEEEAAAAAGLAVHELRKQRKDAEEAAARKENQVAADADEEEEQEAVAGSSKAAASKSKKRKAAAADLKKNAAGNRSSSRSSRRLQQHAESGEEDDEMPDASDDEEAIASAEEAALAKVLAEADDSDDDVDEEQEESDEEEEEEDEPPPSKKARRLPAAAAAAPKSEAKANKRTENNKKQTTKRKNSGKEPAVAAAPAKATSKDTKKGQASSMMVEGKSRKRKAGQERADAEPEADQPEPSATAASAGGRQRSKGSSKAVQSPARKSQRQQKEQDAQLQHTEEEDGPAVSGAGKSSGPRHGRPAGGAQAARIEALEKNLFSNTRRNSYGRADSPGLARTRSDALAAEATNQRRSRLGKNKNRPPSAQL